MGETTFWNPASYARNARFVSDLGEPLLQLLDPKPGEVILDLGCGDGALTDKIAAFGCTVYGVDASHPQIQAARNRGLQGLVMDGRRLGFKRSFDAVFSNAALHWMKQPEQVAAGVSNALKSGGRFIGEFGGKGNVETIHSVLHAALRCRGIDPVSIDPWYYPSPEEYTRLLTALGFNVGYIELIPRPTKLPGDILGWLEVFAQPFIKALPENDSPRYLTDVRNELKERLRDSEGNWVADYVRLRFKASK
ncbi:MAG: class I SAM-dependent methyltransferase [Candidatus Binatia bacterium]